ncbi:MAG: homoserine kinase [Verrucomicrobia bacterium]|nr:homoserine kinase [Verrucomicrobiota bacterium]
MEVTIQVPASTTNLGPGFDCLGVALQIWNRTRISRTDQPMPSQHPPIVEDAARSFFSRAGMARFDFQWHLEGNVPVARGLGSSVTLRLGVVLALNRLAGDILPNTEVGKLCDQLEGHSDNTAAALNGGFVIVNPRTNRLQRFDVSPDLRFVLFIPDFEVITAEARKVLPPSYPRSDIVENLANVASIAAAFATQDYDLLRTAFEDRLHQPYREPLVPNLRRIIEAGQRAGALGGFLSGSGSTVACLTTGNAEPISEAMQAAAGTTGGRTMVVPADNVGASIVETAQSSKTSMQHLREGKHGCSDTPLLHHFTTPPLENQDHGEDDSKFAGRQK